MSVAAKTSEFLSLIESCKHLCRTVRVDPNIYCQIEADHNMEFIATDENAWYGTLIVQWPTFPPYAAAMEVERFIRMVGHGNMPMLFRYEVHDFTGMIRAVYRLPIFTDFFGQQDVDEAVWMLYREWTTIKTFIQRVLDGEDADAVAAVAASTIDAMRNF